MGRPPATFKTPSATLMPSWAIAQRFISADVVDQGPVRFMAPFSFP
jgi:hypothetical protein